MTGSAFVFRPVRSILLGDHAGSDVGEHTPFGAVTTPSPDDVSYIRRHDDRKSASVGLGAVALTASMLVGIATLLAVGAMTAAGMDGLYHGASRLIETAFCRNDVVSHMARQCPVERAN